MVKSLRYDEASSPDRFQSVVIGRLRRAGHTIANANIYSYAASDCDTASHRHADTRVDLPAAESGSGMGAARSV